MYHELKGIPEYSLTVENLPTDFVVRTAQEIELRNGGKKDVPHRHNYYTILLVSKGKGKHLVDYNEFNIEDKALFFVSPGQVHQVVAEPGIGGYVLLFTRDFLFKHQISESLITDIGLFSDIYNVPPILLCSESFKEMEELVCKIVESYNNKDVYFLDAISAWLKLFFIECNRYSSHLSESSKLTLSSGVKLVKEFKALLESNYMKWHKVNDYASHLNVSPDYLNTLIKTSVGKSAKEFIQNRVLLEAKRLGVHTNLSSKEIAFKIGFDDPAHFSKFFKSVANQSFSDFRIKISANQEV